jgi:uncharacterized membrane protein
MSPQAPQDVYPRVRMEALTDGIYAVAMTLLVLDVRFPDDFDPHTNAALLRGLAGLWPKFFPYVLSFTVLSLRWMAAVQVRSRAETVGGAYVRWWLLNLLLTTFVPFTTILVGRHASLAPAVWLYAGTTALIAISSWFQLKLLPDVIDDHHRQGRQLLLLLFLGSALLSIAWSFVDPSQALGAFLINLAGPMLVRRARARASSANV